LDAIAALRRRTQGTNFSGHYRPGDDVSEAFLARLESEGVDLSAFAFGVRDGEEVDMGDGERPNGSKLDGSERRTPDNRKRRHDSIG